MKIDLACGDHKEEGAFGIDHRDLSGVDLVHDLESFPWPIEDDVADTIIISHFWEHIKPWLTLRFMEEVHRICKDGAKVIITSPYGVGRRYVSDPTHCNPSNEFTFSYFDPTYPLWGVYRPPPFIIDQFLKAEVDEDFDFQVHLTCIKKNEL